MLVTCLPCAAGEVEHRTGPADDVGVEIRVPSFRPTPTVQSVLGLLPGEYYDPVRTSIQLLPPATTSATPAVNAVSSPIAAAHGGPAAVATAVTTPAPATITLVTPSTVPAAIMVTRENAKLGAPQRSWQVDVPSFRPVAPHLVVPPTSQRDDANLAALNSMRQDDAAKEVATPPQEVPQHAGKSTIMAANRRGFPAWIEPATSNAVAAPLATDEGELSQRAWRPRGEADQPQSLRDPRPELSSPTLSSPQNKTAPATEVSPPSKSVGSGLRTLAPLKAMLTLDTSPAQTQHADPLPRLDELPDHADADTSVQVLDKNPRLDKATNPHDGNNEGDATGPVEIDEWDGTTMPETEDAADAPLDLSTVDIKALVIDSVEPLRPTTDIADLYAVQERAAETDKNRPLSKIPAVKPALSSTANRDATGRVKTHGGVGAVENLDPTIARMQQTILQTLRSFHAQTEQADSRSNWGMMHAIMIYGVDTRIIARRRNYSAIAWMAGNNVCRGNRMMTTERGQIKAREGTGLQGHQAQWLATLSLASVPANYPLYADNQKFTIEDLVHVEASACEEGKELTFTLIGLSHYLDTDATWAGVRGEPWDFQRLIAAELDQPVVGAACGGTHRLMGFAHALRKRRLEGKPITGQWKRAETFLNDFVQYTYTLQNRDGSFSTNWFESPQDNGELSRKVQTTGHILEFLLTHLPDEEIVNDKVVAAVRFLTSSIRRVKMDDAGVGYRAHALRSLAMYHQRVYGIAPVYPPGQMAFGQHRNQHLR